MTSLQASAFREVDDRIAGGHKDVAGGKNIGAAKVNHAVGVGMGGGLMNDLDGFAIEEVAEIQHVGVIGYGGPCRGWSCRKRDLARRRRR